MSSNCSVSSPPLVIHSLFNFSPSRGCLVLPHIVLICISLVINDVVLSAQRAGHQKGGWRFGQVGKSSQLRLHCIVILLGPFAENPVVSSSGIFLLDG